MNTEKADAEKVLHGGFTRVSLLLDNCGGPLSDVAQCEKDLKVLLKMSGMTVVSTTRVPYAKGPSGYMLFFGLEESFVLVETWPEIRRVKAIVDLCDFNRSNHDRCLMVSQGVRRVFHHKEMLVRLSVETAPGILIDKKELEAAMAAYSPVSSP